ncbi:hypothetical protein G797_01459 [Escherichia coli HVH 139 (4-3192644)]|nr:hypothetical protein G797_01459 [Escherichia coli HVH 139 (4-3192644)]
MPHIDIKCFRVNWTNNKKQHLLQILPTLLFAI